MHIPHWGGTVGNERFSILIHGRIAEAVARNAISVQPESNKFRSRYFIHFLVVVNIIHDFAHIVRSFFHGIHLDIFESENYPYIVELGNSMAGLQFPEAGFQAEQAIFGGTVGVVFEDEVDHDGERPAFFEIEYHKIAYLFLQCADGRAYRLGEVFLCFSVSVGPLISYHAVHVDSDDVAAKMESGSDLLTPFDTTTLPTIPMPKLPKERTCAWLNSTHLPRRWFRTLEHPDKAQGRTLPYSPPTPRAARMEDEYRRARRRRCIVD